MLLFQHSNTIVFKREKKINLDFPVRDESLCLWKDTPSEVKAMKKSKASKGKRRKQAHAKAGGGRSGET